MGGQVGQERQDQVGVVAMSGVEVVGEGPLGVHQGPVECRSLVGGQDVDRRDPTVVPVVVHLLVGEDRHGSRR